MSWQKIARRIRVPMGFVFAAVFLWLARPTTMSLLASLLLTIPGLWLRAYASGYVKKNAELAMTGPYAHTRNPLYLGSMMIAFGFALASMRWEIAVALAVLFAVIYLPTIRSEEAFLRTQFARFEEYCAAVPRIFPRITAARLSTDRGSFAQALYVKHREYNALIGATAIYAALIARMVLRR